ncbi:MAG: AMP-dependent synthetase/ligase [Myxococcota bacterium]
MSTSFPSVAAMLKQRIQSTPDADAFYFPDTEDVWQTLRWSDVGQRTESIAAGLHTLGIGLEDRCSILCNTRIEWILIDLGILCAGGATTTIYPSCTAEESAYIINDSGTRILFVEDDAQVDKILAVKDGLPNLVKIINISGKGGHGDFVITLDNLEAMGKEFLKQNRDAYDSRIDSITKEHIATLIYTSGTTGKPKGVVLTNDCWIFEAEAMDRMGFLSSADVQFLWLPLSHSFGKVLEVASIHIGFPTAIDGRLDRIVQNLGEVKPTFVAAVPRIFEKVYNKIVSGAKDKGKTTHRIFKWSLRVGSEVSALRQEGLEPKSLLKLKYGMANVLVFNKIKKLFGGRLKFFISGSAPLSYDIATFFHAADILILEGYGLTESSAASFVNRPDDYKFGTVGKALPDVDVKLDYTYGEGEDEGEILMKGRGIMREYYNLDTVTSATIEDRWLRTGDIGRIDSDGFLKITDRKKDLIKTSGGKYVAPQKLEGKIKALCPFVSQAIVHGNARNFCSMLVTLDEESIKKWAEKAGLEDLSYTDLTKHDAVRSAIQPFIDTLNSDLASYETIKKFAILPEDFSIEGGELTPSMKVKRKAVESKYNDVLDAFYASALQGL